MLELNSIERLASTPVPEIRNSGCLNTLRLVGTSKVPGFRSKFGTNAL